MRMSLFQNIMILTVVGWLLPHQSGGQSIPSLVDSLEQINDSTFLQDFPFQEYSSIIYERSTAHFVKDISLLEEYQADINGFLDSVHAVLVREISSEPKKFEKLLQKLRFGEALMNLDGIKGFIYPAFGDLVLQSLTTHLDNGVSNNLYSARDEKVQYLVNRLQENKFFVTLPTSDWDKGFGHIKKGNFKYLFRKMRLKLPLLYYAACIALLVFSGFGLNWLRIKLLNKPRK